MRLLYRAEQLANEIKELQGNLGDYNTVNKCATLNDWL